MHDIIMEETCVGIMDKNFGIYQLLDDFEMIQPNHVDIVCFELKESSRL